MPNASILAGLGLFVRRDFLDAELCHDLRRDMISATRTRAMLRPYGQADGARDETVRRTDVAQVPAATSTLVEGRLWAIKRSLEDHFHVQLAGLQGPEFYVYGEGDFFVAHRDSDTDPLAPERIKVRQVSISILLNDATGRLDGEPYSGGAMVFYGRRADRGGPGFGIPLESEEGMLIAFRSDWFHEVQPITSGRRYSIVSWFF
jgi:predicted 2-oxoglutarate/Fe(II)-dependent dioxygenase YbiX